MSRELYLAILLGSSAAAIAIWLYLSWQEQILCRQLKAIVAPGDLDRLRLVVKQQMLAVITLIPLALLPLVVFLVARVIGPAPTFLEKLYMVLYGWFVAAEAAQAKVREGHLRSLPTATDWLRNEYERIVYTWKHRLLPDW